ncbi:MAG: LamG domain-containing protein [Candidatus Nanoarchaeia archaeon]|nr:LamG domain-containing protein [Candidatus Nanoarchaeia archaeon]
MKKTQLAFEDFIIGFLMFFMLASVIFLFINSGAGSGIDFFNTSIYQDSNVSLDYLYLNAYTEGSTSVTPSKIKFNPETMQLNFSFSRTGLPSGEFDDKLIDFPINVKISWLNCSMFYDSYLCSNYYNETIIDELIKYDTYFFNYTFNPLMRKYLNCNSNIIIEVEFLSSFFKEGYLENNKYVVPVDFCFFDPLDVKSQNICVPINPNSTECSEIPIAFDSTKNYLKFAPENFEDLKLIQGLGVDLETSLVAHFTLNEGSGGITTDSINNIRGALQNYSSCLGENNICQKCYILQNVPSTYSYFTSGYCLGASFCNFASYYQITGTECTVNNYVPNCFYGILSATGYSTCSNTNTRCGYRNLFIRTQVSNPVSNLYRSYGFCSLIEFSTAVFSDDAKYGKSIKFNGIDSYVQIDDSEFLKPEILSLSAWIKTPGNSSDFIFEKQKSLWVSYAMSVSGDGTNSKAQCSIGLDSSAVSQSVISISSVGDNEWHNIVCTYDGSTLKLYFDGLLESSKNAEGQIYYDGETGARIGYHLESGTYFNGLIDDVKIFNKALNPIEVKLLYDINYDWRLEFVDYSEYNPYAVKFEFSNNHIKDLGFTVNLSYIKNNVETPLYLNKSLRQENSTFVMFFTDVSLGQKLIFPKSKTSYIIFDLRDLYTINNDGSKTNLFDSGKVYRCDDDDNNNLFKFKINSYEIEMNELNNEFQKKIGWCLNI